MAAAASKGGVFTSASLPNLAGRVFLVTGGNCGLGLQTAKVLVGKAATVVVTCRDAAKARATVEELRRHAGDAGRVEAVTLDLGNLQSVRAGAEEFLQMGLPLHVLVNNAGIMMCPKSTTADGFETQFGVNHLGHFLLTKLLFSKLRASATKDEPSRIVTLSSSFHACGPREGILFDNLGWDEGKLPKYEPGLAYGHSKFANVVFTQELNRRVTASGTGVGVGDVVCNAVHPGLSTRG